ncbi:MAG: hypothetical protein QE271_14620 [Bacteriovoracaceae bacterium]|nr:hypothetical protein [Bacteriovoracaceae bacterium]
MKRTLLGFCLLFSVSAKIAHGQVGEMVEQPYVVNFDGGKANLSIAVEDFYIGKFITPTNPEGSPLDNKNYVYLKDKHTTGSGIATVFYIAKDGVQSKIELKGVLLANGIIKNGNSVLVNECINGDDDRMSNGESLKLVATTDAVKLNYIINKVKSATSTTPTNSKYAVVCVNEEVVTLDPLFVNSFVIKVGNKPKVDVDAYKTFLKNYVDNYLATVGSPVSEMKIVIRNLLPLFK